MGYPYVSPDGDEERFNQQFIGHLHYSLRTGPTLLNLVHKALPITFSEQASVVAHQNSPLPRHTDKGTNRELDWVIQDDDKIVGYESKYQSTLSQKQLEDELAKLRLNAQDRDVFLVAITTHTRRPGALNDFEEGQVHWMSWTDVSRQLHRADIEETPAEHRPVLQMLRDLFQTEDMQPFTGFDHQDKRQYRHFIRDLRHEMRNTELENRGKLHNWTQKKAQPKSYQRIIPKYIDIPFVHEKRPVNDPKKTGTKRYSYFPVLVDIETHDVYAGIIFNVKRVPGHRRLVGERRQDLVEYAENQQLSLWVATNSINNRGKKPRKTDDTDEMTEWLSEASNGTLYVSDTKYKKALLLKDCTEPDSETTIVSVKRTLLEQKQQFLDSDGFLKKSTLEYFD